MGKILLVNDDGLDAAGIRVLENACREVYPRSEIVVYAPAYNISGASRSMTFGSWPDGSQKLVRVKPEGNDHYRVFGTPADCVDIACRVHEIDLVLSGINHGFNLGGDIHLSGTIQAALHAFDYFATEAAAFSGHNDAITHAEVSRTLKEILRRMSSDEFGGRFISVNFPRPSEDRLEVIQTIPGLYRCSGPLLGVAEDDCIDYNLLDPMSQMEASDHIKTTDVGAITEGLVSLTVL